MKITSRIITSATELAYLEKDLSAFLNARSSNPFLLYPFIEYLMQKASKGSVPAILVCKENEKIVGLAPLAINQSLGFRGVTFLVKFTGSPDIIVEEEYREKVLEHILYVLLKKMRCKSIILNLPAESPNLKALERECRSDKVIFYKTIQQNMNHCIIHVNCSWPDLLNSISGRNKRRFKNTQRHLTEMGQWKSSFIEISHDDQSANDALRKIHAVEKKSWKEGWRLQAGYDQDQDLEGIWKTSRRLVKTNPDFRLMAWFLELSDIPIAYTMVIHYKDTAWIVKTSYANEYRYLSLGTYVVNSAIQDLLNKGTVQKIDFMTDLSFMKTWHPISGERIRFKIVATGLPALSCRIQNSQIGPMLCRTPIVSRFINFTEQTG